MLGKTENLVIVLLIVLILFGGSKIPELARSIGQSVKELKKGFKEGVDDEPEGKTAKSKSKKKA